jgi:uncharacterized damage-inducible protein DinB
MDDPRFPIGEFEHGFDHSVEARDERIASIEELPAKLSAAVSGLDDTRLDTPYRDGGWTVRQLVHHIADSHANAYNRFKLALTEDSPTIKPYHENLWAELADSKLPVDVSLKIIDGLHSRWAALLRSMTDADFQREFVHPETGVWKLEAALALYAWHSQHHTAHITALRGRMGW